MRKLLQRKLAIIKGQLEANNNAMRLYHLTTSYKVLKARELIIIEIMSEYDTMCRKPIIDDIERDFNMGIISLQDKENQINSICIDY